MSGERVFRVLIRQPGSKESVATQLRAIADLVERGEWSGDTVTAWWNVRTQSNGEGHND